MRRPRKPSVAEAGCGHDNRAGSSVQFLENPNNSEEPPFRNARNALSSCLTVLPPTLCIEGELAVCAHPVLSCVPDGDCSGRIVRTILKIARLALHRRSLEKHPQYGYRASRKDQLSPSRTVSLSDILALLFTIFDSASSFRPVLGLLLESVIPLSTSLTLALWPGRPSLSVLLIRHELRLATHLVHASLAATHGKRAVSTSHSL